MAGINPVTLACHAGGCNDSSFSKDYNRGVDEESPRSLHIVVWQDWLTGDEEKDAFRAYQESSWKNHTIHLKYPIWTGFAMRTIKNGFLAIHHSHGIDLVPFISNTLLPNMLFLNMTWNLMCHMTNITKHSYPPCRLLIAEVQKMQKNAQKSGWK